MAVLKFLLIFFIVIYLLGYLGKLLFIYWLKKVMNQKMNQNAYEQKKEGEVTINKNAKTTKTAKKYNTSNSEYVDYEEIKD